MLDPVLDPHAHEGVQPEVDQRQLTGQVIDVVAHRLRDDAAQPLGRALAGVRVPPRCVGVDGGQAVAGRCGRSGILRTSAGGGTHCTGGFGRPTQGVRRRSVLNQRQGRGERLADQHRRTVRLINHIDLHGESAEGACHQRGDLTGGRQRAVAPEGGDRGLRGHRVHGGLGDGLHAGHVADRGGEGGAAVRQRDPSTRDTTASSTTGAGCGPVALQVPVHARNVLADAVRSGTGSTGSGTAGTISIGGIERPEVDVPAAHVQLTDGAQQRVDAGLLALKQVHQAGLAGLVGEGGVHHRHQRDRVRGELHEGAEALVEQAAGGVREPHRVAGAAQEVLRVVHCLAGVVGHPTVNGAVQRGVDGLRCDVADLRGELAEDRVEHAGVFGTLDLQQTGELALAVQVLHQVGDRLGRATDGGHAGRGVDRGLDGGELRVLLLELHQVVHTELDDGHRALLVLGQQGLALAHQPGTVAGDGDGVLHGQATDGVAGSDLTHGLADDGGRAQPQPGHQVGQGDLDGGDADLGGLGAEVLGVVEDHLDDRPAGLTVDDLVDLVQPGGELRGELVQLLAHLAVLGAETGVHPDRTLALGAVGHGHPGALLAVGQAGQPGGGLLDVMGQDDAAGTAVVASTGGGRQGGEVGTAGLVLQPAGEVGRCGAAARGQQSRDRDQSRQRDTGGGIVGISVGLGVVLHTGPVEDRLGGSSSTSNVTSTGNRRCPLRPHHDHVRIRSTEAETGHTGDGRTGVLRPLARILHDLQVVAVEVDVGVRAGEVHRRRQHTLAHRRDDLDHPGDTGGGLGVAEVGLLRAEQQRGGDVAARAEHLAECTCLDRITEDGAGAVGLDIVHLGGLDARVTVGRTQDGGLCLRVRGGQSVGTSVLVHRGTGDDAEDVVTGGHGVRQTLEDEHTGTVGPDDAVGVLGEGVDAAGGAEHAEFGESDRGKGAGQQVHTTGEGDGGVTVAQGAHGLVDRHQRCGAGGVQGHRRSTEVEGVGDPVGDHRGGVAGQGVGVRLGRVGADEHAVVVVGRTDEDTGVGATQGVRRDAGVLKCLPGQGEHDALLRIHVRRLQRRQAEELRVEGGDVLDVTAGQLCLGHAPGHFGIVGVLGPASLRQLADAAAALLEHRPHLGDVLRTGVGTGHADDGDLAVLGGELAAGASGVLPGPCRGSTASAGATGGDEVGQRGDGVVLVGHRGVQGDPGQPLQLAGQDDDIATGEAELLHGAVVGDLRDVQAGGALHPVAQPDTHLGGGGRLMLRVRHRR